jgi:hypothetical protein
MTRGVVVLGALLASCATVPNSNVPLDLSSPPVQFSQGKVTVVLVDEYGVTLPGMRVDLYWDEPSHYRTSAFTNRMGEVSFTGIPPVAEVSIDHPGGNYTRTLLVPQTGRPELRVTVDTLGGGEAMREQEKARLAPRQTSR